MSSSDPEDDICVMDLIKRRKAATSTKSNESNKPKSPNSKNVAKEKKVANGKGNGQSKAKESETKKRKRKDSDDEEEESDESEDSDSSASESESDDDDDKPIGQLVKKRKQDSSKDVSKKSSEKKAKSSSSSSLSKKSSEFYNETDKGMLVQRLLVRWWYVIEWPKPEEIGSPPPGYESLDGFPGVFICTRSDELGNIVDLRNKENCPCLKNLSKWMSSRLKETCIQAYEKQMEVLQKLGEGESETYRNLKQELREIKAINPDKADREAMKYTF